MNFESLSYTDQKEVVLLLLHEYSIWDFEKREEMMKVVEWNGWQYSMGWKQCAEYAADFLVKDHVRSMKFEHLVTQMQKMGLDNMYYHAMREHLSEALK